MSEGSIVMQLEEYFKIPTLKLKLSEFKEIAQYHGIKVKLKRKQEYINELYDKMKQLFFIKKIQRAIRIKLRYILVSCHGPAHCNTSCCVNDTDFYTLDNIADIAPPYLFSYKDFNGKIYAFHWVSFLKLAAGKTEVHNPYNRNVIGERVIQTFARYLFISSKVFKINLRENIEDEPQMTKQVRYQQRLTDIFMKIDSLGNYSQIEWYESLSHLKLLRFIQELKDIWVYRLNLTNEMKLNILGLYDPFINLNVTALTTISFDEIKNFGLNIIEKFISSGRTDEYKTLGSIYVLSALTLVNHSAATALPHLYESLI